jgi:hypothetical protein
MNMEKGLSSTPIIDDEIRGKEEKWLTKERDATAGTWGPFSQVCLLEA